MTEPESQTRLGEVDDEELVAYLDGELDAEAMRRVEGRLGEDPAYRQRLQSLENAWEALDMLPRDHLNESFTRSTLEMVAASVDQEMTQALTALPRRRRLTWLYLAGAAAVCSAVGFSVSRWSLPDPNEGLVADLPVLEKLDVYRETGDVEFLRQLDASKLFAQESDE